MKALLVNKYFYQKGGSELSFFTIGDLLEKNNHQVSWFAMESPQDIDSPYSKYFVPHIDLNANHGIASKLKVAATVLYSFEAKSRISKLIDDEKPDIAHLHNIHHQLSPSIIDALKTKSVPVVLHLHDYKLACASYAHLSHGQICEACKGGKYYNVYFQKCVKNSAAKSALNTLEMYLHHNLLHVYEKVDAFISPSRFLADKVNGMGFEKEIIHLPNFLDSSEYQSSYDTQSDYIVYFGRLSHEKGIATLIKAMNGIDIKLKIVGDGPLRKDMEQLAAQNSKISFTGFLSGAPLHDEIRNSLFVVVPSEWYENYPYSVLESFAFGKPVLGARIGGIPEMVKDNETGLTFESGNVNDLREKITAMLSDMDHLRNMGHQARNFIETNNSPEVYYSRLMEIYEKAMHGQQSV